MCSYFELLSYSHFHTSAVDLVYPLANCKAFREPLIFFRALCFPNKAKGSQVSSTSISIGNGKKV